MQTHNIVIKLIDSQTCCNGQLGCITSEGQPASSSPHPPCQLAAAAAAAPMRSCLLAELHFAAAAFGFAGQGPDAADSG